ncbi:MFS general substrate transporter [Trichoderma aethiopicum]
MRRRTKADRTLAHLTDEELERDVQSFVENHLPSVRYEDLLRAARVAKDIRLYDEVARQKGYNFEPTLPVQLTKEEKYALRRERDVPFSEKGMRIVILTVSIAALLQGFVQSSFNGASLYREEWGLRRDLGPNDTSADNWKLGAANAAPFFFAALIGCPLALPINYWFGRRGGICVAALLIFASSLGAAYARTWYHLVGIRAINGVGMGIKAVSTPILAGETAVGFWRGSAILAWQLWVAFGIMLGFAFNLVFTKAQSSLTTLSLINAAPMVPSFFLFMITLFLCPESPRYHLTRGPNYNVQKAYISMVKLRNTELQALRDLYLIYKSLEQESMALGNLDAHAFRSPGFVWVIRDFFRQYAQLFQQRRLYNAVISTSTVNLAQQLCGINVLAFYSGYLFNGAGSDVHSKLIPMAYSLGFGAINFLCGLPAVRSIDTLGRRKWLLATLPFMALFMFGAALAFTIEARNIRVGVAAFFLFKAGTAWAISINLGFAGLLSIVFPSINSGLTESGALGLFSGLNVVALVMVFLLVEETKRHTLEELDHIFAVSKRKFMRFQLCEYLPWLVRYYIFGSKKPRPELYEDLIWGPSEGEDLAPFRAVDLVGYYSEPSVPEPVELAHSRSRDLPQDGGQYGSVRSKELGVKGAADPGDDSEMQATNNDGPVSIRY